MRGAAEIDHCLINLDQIAFMIKDYEDDYTAIYIAYTGGSNHRVYFDTPAQADKFYNDFKECQP